MIDILIVVLSAAAIVATGALVSIASSLIAAARNRKFDEQLYQERTEALANLNKRAIEYIEREYHMTR